MSSSSITDIPKIAVQHNDSNTIISEATIQFIQSDCEDIDALEKRAKALAWCAQSELALRDASEIIRLAPPSSSIGHSLAGWIHTLFGQHETALQYYNDALRAEDDAMKWKEIDECRRHNAQQLLKRIDFVSNLPFELLSFILPRTLMILTIGDLSYLHVCTTWRQRVLQTAQLQWIRPRVLTSHAMHLLHAYAPSIQHLELLCPVFYPLGMQPGTYFSTLRSLDITLDSNRCMPVLLALFQSMGPTLKELHLWFHQRIQGQWIRLDGILDRFPYIELFSSGNVDLSPLRNTYSNLKSLLIQSVRQPLEENEILALLKQLPALRYLKLPRCQSSRPLSIIHQYCPSLRTLTYSMGEDADTICNDIMVINDAGLHSLTIEALHGFQTQDLAAVLTANSDTLVNLSLFGETASQGNILNLDPNVRFARLRNIVFRLGAGQQGKDFLQWLLKHAPNVEAVVVARYNVDDPHVYASMKDIRSLDSLDFVLPSPSLIRVLEHHTSLGLESSLHTITINFNGDHGLHALSVVSRLPTLEVIDLQLGDAIMGQEFVAIMEKIFVGCHFLEELGLHCDHELPHDIIHTFRMCAHLASLTLNSPNDWGECLMDLLDCPSLISLDVPTDDLPYAIQTAIGHLLVD